MADMEKLGFSKVYRVRSIEEELGDMYFEVTAPQGVSDSEVTDAFLMASKYASPCFDDDSVREEYDEYFDEMLKYRYGSNGLNTFKEYLERKGYKVREMFFDFTFEW